LPCRRHARHGQPTSNRSFPGKTRKREKKKPTKKKKLFLSLCVCDSLSFSLYLLWRVLIVVALRRRAEAARAEESVAAAAAKGAKRRLVERLVAVCRGCHGNGAVRFSAKQGERRLYKDSYVTQL
jgi:hypothetical protein